VPYLYRSFSAKEPYQSWPFCGKRPVTYHAFYASLPPCCHECIKVQVSYIGIKVQVFYECIKVQVSYIGRHDHIRVACLYKRPVT